MAHKHKVRTHRWEDGMLKTFEHEFESWEAALGFAEASDEPAVKIYHENGELLHTISNSPLPVPTYA